MTGSRTPVEFSSRPPPSTSAPRADGFTFRMLVGRRPRRVRPMYARTPESTRIHTERPEPRELPYTDYWMAGGPGLAAVGSTLVRLSLPAARLSVGARRAMESISEVTGMSVACRRRRLPICARTFRMIRTDNSPCVGKTGAAQRRICASVQLALRRERSTDGIDPGASSRVLLVGTR